MIVLRNLTAAKKRGAEAVSSCIWHQVEKQQEEKKRRMMLVMMRRMDDIGRV